MQAVRGHRGCFPLAVSYCWPFWHYMTPCSFKHKRQQTKSTGYMGWGKHHHAHLSAGTQWRYTGRSCTYLGQSILLQIKPLTYRTEHLALGGWRGKQYLTPPAVWHAIYNSSLFLYILRLQYRYLQLARQMLQNLHVPLLLQKCHLFCNHWSH